MVKYQASAHYMDSDDVMTVVGLFRSQMEARRACQRHARQILEFRTRPAGIWKAQGPTYWYEIVRVEQDHT